MTIAHDSEILGAANTATPYDTAITPTNPVRGVCVIIVCGATTDQVTSVTYGTSTGAVPLTRGASPYGWASEATEAGGVYIYWAGNSVIWPAGTQTVRIVRTGATDMRAMVSTMTCAVGQVVALDSGATGQSASVANPSWTHTSLVNNVVAYEGIHSGLQTMTTTPATNWTLQGSQDVGVIGRGWARRTLATAGALAPGWIAATADDFVGCSIAFKEAPPPLAAVRPPQIVSQYRGRW